MEIGTAVATLSSGPRFFHFVIGGSTPAAMAADWLTSLLIRTFFQRLIRLRFSCRRRRAAMAVRLVGLPSTWGGALVASATFANFTGLACATHWWANSMGRDVTSRGLAAVSQQMPAFSGGYVHPRSQGPADAGHGRDSVQVCAADTIGRVDLSALEKQLAELSQPAVIIGNAGEVNAGDFDLDRRLGGHRRTSPRLAAP